MSERAVQDAASEIPPGFNGLSSIDTRRLLREVGPNRWVKHDRLARVREDIGLLLDRMAVMLIIAAVVYFLRGETRDAVVLALALIPVLGVDVLFEARSRAALDKLARVGRTIPGHGVRDLRSGSGARAEAAGQAPAWS